MPHTSLHCITPAVISQIHYSPAPTNPNRKQFHSIKLQICDTGKQHVECVACWLRAAQLRSRWLSKTKWFVTPHLFKYGSAVAVFNMQVRYLCLLTCPPAPYTQCSAWIAFSTNSLHVFFFFFSFCSLKQAAGHKAHIDQRSDENSTSKGHGREDTLLAGQRDPPRWYVHTCWRDPAGCYTHTLTSEIQQQKPKQNITKKNTQRWLKACRSIAF